MILYAGIVITALILTGTANTFAVGVPFYDVVVSLFIGILGIAVLAIIPHFLIRAFPKSLFEPGRKYYNSFKFEKGFYSFIKVKSWKNKIPDVGGKVSNFSKGTLVSSNDTDYLYKFLVETCYSEVVHTICAIDGFLIFFLPINFTILIPIAVVNCLLHAMPVFVQRYVRPRLMHVYNRRLETEAGEAA